MQGTLSFKDEDVLILIEGFIQFLMEGSLRPAMYYTQECELPTILTLAASGEYKKAITDMEHMKKFSELLTHEIDNAANMDF